MNAWNKLPSDLQAIVEVAARETSIDLFQENLVKGYEALEKFKEKGVEVIYLPESEIKKVRVKAMKVWEEYADKSPEAREVLDSQKKWMKSLGLID